MKNTGSVSRRSMILGAGAIGVATVITVTAEKAKIWLLIKILSNYLRQNYLEYVKNYI